MDDPPPSRQISPAVERHFPPKVYRLRAGSGEEERRGPHQQASASALHRKVSFTAGAGNLSTSLSSSPSRVKKRKWR
jgi:hypothetical protein